MSKLNPLLLAVTVDIDSAVEAEFNEWYNHKHLADLLKCPGWLGASRFEAVEGAPRYLALYQLEDARARQTDEFLRARGFSPRLKPYIKQINSTLYRKIYPGSIE
ncbi:MAG: hypothetical protein HYX87_08890 [Chloroflexi bacterium]|nr:hypothetical protein [Chloroflexota bacterium]